MKTTLLLVLFLAFQAGAQTPILRTNIVQAPVSFREVDGKLYNSQRSMFWKTVRGEVQDVNSGGVVIKSYSVRTNYESYVSAPLSGAGRDGAFSGAISPAPIARLVKTAGPVIFIRNFHAGTYGGEIAVPAMRVGNTNIDGRFMEAWDCGLPHYVTNVISTKP